MPVQRETTSAIFLPVDESVFRGIFNFTLCSLLSTSLENKEFIHITQRKLINILIYDISYYIIGCETVKYVNIVKVPSVFLN